MAPQNPDKQKILTVLPSDHVLGGETAVMTVVAYCDFECPYCRRAFDVIKRLQVPLKDRLRYVFRHFPLSQKHPFAQQAAELAEAAAAQGKFWPVHDFLFSHQDRLQPDDVYDYAAKVGLDVDRLKDEVARRVYAERVMRDKDGGIRLGVTGTPTLFINEERHTDEETLEHRLRRAA